MPLTLRLDGQALALDRTLSAGSDGSCELSLPKLRGQHAIVEVGPERVVIAPAHADAEVVVNGAPVFTRRLLRAGDTVRLGPYEGSVDYEDTVAPLRTAELALAILKRTSGGSTTVVIAEGAGLGDGLELTEDGRSYTIGRGAGSDLRVDDESISREHARLVTRRGGVLVRDLGSARGTFLGEARLEADRDAEWPAGVALRVGKVVLRVDVPARVEEVAAALVPASPAQEVPVTPEEAPVPAASVELASAAHAVEVPVAKSPPTPKRRPEAPRLVPAILVLLVVASVGGMIWLFASSH